MKLFVRLAAMMLAAAMLLSLGITAASADTCYEVLKYTFSVEENGDFAWLGQGTLVAGEEPENPENNDVFFYISFKSNYASVVGRNAEGEPETCLWMEPEPSSLLLASVQVAASYEELTSYLDQCTGLVLVLDSGTEVSRVYIASPEDAQAYLTLMQEALDGLAQGE